MHEQIQVTINTDGTTKIDFTGYEGKACMDASEKLRQLLADRFGVQVETTVLTPKPELLQAESDPTQQQQRGTNAQQQ